MAYVVERRRKHGTFYAVVDSIAGKKIWRSAGKDKELAYAWAGQLIRYRKRREAGLPEEKPVRQSTWTLEKLKEKDLEAAANDGRELASRKRRWRVIASSLGDVPLEMVSPSMVDLFIQKRKKAGAGPATINRDLSVLSAAWKLGIRLGQVQGNPWLISRSSEMKARRPSVALTTCQIHSLLRLFRDPMKAAVELLLLTGSRHGEMPNKNQVQLVYKEHKRGVSRAFRITRRLRAVLDRKPKWSRRSWYKNIRKFEIPTLRPHDLRHTAATLAAYNGATIPEIQALLGHRSPQMAARVYMHVHPNLLEPVNLGLPVGYPRPRKKPRMRTKKA